MLRLQLMRLTPRQRLALIDHINELVSVDFERLVFTLEAPRSVLPSHYAAQGDRSIALLDWVNSPNGCGMPELLDILGAIAPLPASLEGLSPASVETVDGRGRWPASAEQESPTQVSSPQENQGTVEPLSKTITSHEMIVPPERTFECEVVRVDQRGTILEQQTSQTVCEIVDLGNGVTLELVKIPGGSFVMGSPPDERERKDREGPQHRVTVPSFWMGRYPVTQAQWRAIASMPPVNQALNPAPSRFTDVGNAAQTGNCLPVEQVSWHDAVEACERLRAHTGHLYRLPSEAEWEYACRAGTTTPFHFGETITTDLANYQGTDYEGLGWSGSYGDSPKGEYRQCTTAIDTFPYANAFGLSDMHGNVWEWCQDSWHQHYEGAPTDGSAWQELSPQRHKSRVRRGGSWYADPVNCRSASRYGVNPGDRYPFLGFRVAVLGGFVSDSSE